MSRHFKSRKAFTRTLLIVGTFSFIATLVAFVIQKKGEASIETLCSYLDPPIIDLAAFAAALYLIIEGIYHLVTFGEFKTKESVLAAIRIAFGFCILTLHTMQFLHK